MDAQSWDARYEESELVWSAGPNVFVAEHLADHPRGRALDVAAGEGRNAIWLAERGFTVEALDFSEVAASKARELAAHRGVDLTVTVADVTEPFTVAPADVVLVAYLHLPREVERDVLRRAAELVLPGGTFLLVAHARRNLTDGVGGPQDPQLLPTPQEVTDALADTFLEIVEAGEVTREVEVDGQARVAIDVLVRATRPA
ncbi:MAG: class I SAM-dependent methyltransferase [Nitriliruptoraceae bacterium]